MIGGSLCCSTCPRAARCRSQKSDRSQEADLQQEHGGGDAGRLSAEERRGRYWSETTIERLPGLCAGQHEGRQQRGTHGLPLRVVQRRKDVGNVHRRVADSTGLTRASRKVREGRKGRKGRKDRKGRKYGKFRKFRK